MVHPDI
jgi:putative transposase